MSDQDQPNSDIAQRVLCAVDHVADKYVAYPGQDVTLYTRVRVQQAVPGLVLAVTLGEGLRPGPTAAPGNAPPRLVIEQEAASLIWAVDEVEAGQDYEYEVTASVEHIGHDAALQSQATVRIETADGEQLAAVESVTIAVSTRGAWIENLPALYEKDELMGHMLMLFESFWKPIEQRIEHLPYYLDPKTAAPDFLPWLASWLGVVLADHLSEAQRRRLIRSALPLYRRRGTKRGLQGYLEILGEKAQIVEHQADSLRLGPEGRLGPGVALGKFGRPHTFTVILEPPPGASTGDEREDARRARLRLETIRAVIEAEKPAHTGYILRLDTDPPASKAEG